MITSSEPRSGQRPPMPLWAASCTLLAGREEEFFKHFAKTSRSLQADDVHDLRVASRRLREAVALCAPRPAGKKASRVVKQIKAVTGMLGELRNSDEAVLFFSSLASQESAPCADQLEALLSVLRREREQAHRKLEKRMTDLDQKALRAGLAALWGGQNLYRKSEVDPFMSMRFFAFHALTERSQPLVELLPLAVMENNSQDQHRLRIAVKKMRYRLEILAPLLKSGYQELHDALKGYQDVLGKLHDLDVFRDLVQDRVADAAGREHQLQVRALRNVLELLELHDLECCHRRPLSRTPVRIV